MTTLDEIIKELKTSIAYGEELQSIRDNQGQWVDGYLPIYNNQIIDEWKEMPNEYDNRGAQELGHMEEVTIIGLMSLDLYLYYSDLVSQALDAIESEA